MSTRTKTNSEPNIELLQDWKWRLTNLYWIRDPDGRSIKLIPTDEQWDILNAIYTEHLTQIFILKARQLGMSTIIDIVLLDQLLFKGGVQAALVDLTHQDATKKLANKIKFAFNHLPQQLRSAYDTGKDSDKMFQVKPINAKSFNEVQAGTNARGDTFQFLHISEWGSIQLEDEHRSLEILTGAFPAAKAGIRIIETTWKGGKSGPLWEIAKRAIETPEDQKTPEDFTMFFFPWYTDKRYHIKDPMNRFRISHETNKYLDEIEQQEGIKFEHTQRLWYDRVAMKLGFYRFREFPSTLEECFRGLIEGAIYQEQVLRARNEDRILDFPIAENVLTHTFWDLGSPEHTVTWLVQFHGQEIHFVDIICESSETLPQRVGRLLSKFPLGSHFLPHDAHAKEKSGKSFTDQLAELGLGNLVVLPRPTSIWPGINYAHSIFNRFVFHKTRCARGIEGLDCYRTKKDKTLGEQTETPVHDWSSHIADPIRLLAEAEQAGLFTRQLQGVVPSSKSRRRRSSLAITR